MKRLALALAVALSLAGFGAAYGQFGGGQTGIPGAGPQIGTDGGPQVPGSGPMVPSGGGGGSGPPVNALLSQTGVCIEAQAGSCIMVQ
jgi:hypothetical protein